MEKINGRKLSLIFIFILILLVIALLVGKFTYSYLGPTISDDLETQGEVTASGDTLIFTKGNNLSLSATTDNFTTGGTNLTSTTNPKVKLVASTKTNQASATYYVGVLIKNNTYVYTTSGNTPELILTIKDEKGNNVSSGVDGLTYVTSGGVSGFDVTGKKGLFNIKTDYPISTTSSSAGTTHTWTFTLTFVNLGTDQSDNENASMNVDIYLQKEEYKLSLNDYVISQYTGTQGENSIYYHDSSLDKGAGDNSYRYAGANPNNFVCFASDASPCPTDNLYRIIGVIDDKVKLIKYDFANSDLLGTDGGFNGTEIPESDYVGKLTSVSLYKRSYYDSDKTLWINDWRVMQLNIINLNKNFLNKIGDIWSSKIASSIWTLGSPSDMNNTYLYKVYEAEQNGNTFGPAKVGLMSASDYGYARIPTYWQCIDCSQFGITDNWMYMGIKESIVNNPPNQTPSYKIPSFSLIDGISPIRPVFYLNSGVIYASGTGTISDPIILD